MGWGMHVPSVHAACLDLSPTPEEHSRQDNRAKVRSVSDQAVLFRGSMREVYPDRVGGIMDPWNAWVRQCRDLAVTRFVPEHVVRASRSWST